MQTHTCTHQDTPTPTHTRTHTHTHTHTHTQTNTQTHTHTHTHTHTYAHTHTHTHTHATHSPQTLKHKTRICSMQQQTPTQPHKLHVPSAQHRRHSDLHAQRRGRGRHLVHRPQLEHAPVLRPRSRRGPPRGRRRRRAGRLEAHRAVPPTLRCTREPTPANAGSRRGGGSSGGTAAAGPCAATTVARRDLLLAFEAQGAVPGPLSVPAKPTTSQAIGHHTFKRRCTGCTRRLRVVRTIDICYRQCYCCTCSDPLLPASLAASPREAAVRGGVPQLFLTTLDEDS